MLLLLQCPMQNEPLEVCQHLCPHPCVTALFQAHHSSCSSPRGAPKKRVNAFWSLRTESSACSSAIAAHRAISGPLQLVLLVGPPLG